MDFSTPEDLADKMELVKEFFPTIDLSSRKRVALWYDILSRYDIKTVERALERIVYNAKSKYISPRDFAFALKAVRPPKDKPRDAPYIDPRITMMRANLVKSNRQDEANQSDAMMLAYYYHDMFEQSSMTYGKGFPETVTAWCKWQIQIHRANGTLDRWPHYKSDFQGVMLPETQSDEVLKWYQDATGHPIAFKAVPRSQSAKTLTTEEQQLWNEVHRQTSSG